MLLINADDFGLSKEVNEAIDVSFRAGYIQRATLMVNMPYAEEAVRLAQTGGYADKIGLHLNVIEGEPLTEGIKDTVFCTDGRFNGGALRRQRNRFYLNRGTRKALKEELRAQLEKYLSYGFSLRHVDSHEHSHTNPSVIRLLLPLLKAYGFTSIRLSRNIPEGGLKGFKRLYKKALNRKIKAFNRKYQGANRDILYFGAQTDVEEALKEGVRLRDGVEMEAHPLMGEDGKLVDALHRKNLQDWLQELEEKFVD